MNSFTPPKGKVPAGETGRSGDPAVQPSSGAPSPEQVLECLQRIVADGHCDATDRSRRLLQYLVLETLDGRASRIKAYSIATEVLGRPSSFDPQKDPIVRIEAARLRRMLEHYYLTEGRNDPVVIAIPKGAYIPYFAFAEAPQEAPLARKAEPVAAGSQRRVVVGLALAAFLAAAILALLWKGPTIPDGKLASKPAVHVPGLLVMPLTDLTRSADSAVLAQGLTERIIEKMSRFAELSVITGDTGHAPASTADVRYEFGGTLRSQADKLIVQARLVDRADGHVIWADSFDVDMKPSQLFNVEVVIADQIATRIADPNGIVFDAERKAALDDPPENWSDYVCTLGAYAYRASLDAGQHAPMVSCLTRAVADYPDYATAWALLSLAYVDEFRFMYPPPAGDPAPSLTRAYDAARRAIALAPDNVRSQQAMMMALFFRKDYAASIELGRKAMAINPNDVELKGEFGYRLALTGKWEDGCRLLGEAVIAGNRENSYFSTGLSLCQYFRNDLEGAVKLIQQADVGNNPAYHAIAAAILAEAGLAAEAESHRGWLEAHAPADYAALVLSLSQRLVNPADRQRFISSLRKAGFVFSS